MRWCVVSFAGLLTLVAAVSPMQAANSIPADPAIPSACSLLSPLEVGRDSGMAVSEGATRVRNGAFSGCSFEGGQGRRVVILVRRIPPGDPWVLAQLARMSRGSYREVTGIGSRSFRYVVQGGEVLCVFSAGYYVQVSRLGPGTANLDLLVRNALARLP